MAQSPRQYELIFQKKQQVSADAYTFFFSKNDLTFTAGQYMRWRLNIPQPDERGTSRFFTISSAPSEDFVTITTRVIQSSFKQALAELKPGEPITAFGPLGEFVVQPASGLIFLAGGIGITPFHSIIKDHSLRNIATPITLFSSFKTVEERIFMDELQQLAAQHSWLKIYETITRPEESKAAWTGYTGHIDAAYIKSHISPDPNLLYYISGPPPMVEALHKTVTSLGVPDTQIKTEQFTGY